ELVQLWYLIINKDYNNELLSKINKKLAYEMKDLPILHDYFLDYDFENINEIYPNNINYLLKEENAK
ncbi:hypothetical protein INO28_14420, partial [Staphylococcus aureus]|nr:hypothetical protein [Staphylococcus aureus]